MEKFNFFEIVFLGFLALFGSYSTGDKAFSVPDRISSAVIGNTNGINSCPLQLALNAATRNNLRNEVIEALQDGRWVEVVNLDLTNSSHFCPAPWTEVVITNTRLCASSSCVNSVIFNVSETPYSSVRGKVTGYGTGGLDAFFRKNTANEDNIDVVYLDGVSITHGSSPRKHIWSFAVGYVAGNQNRHCPCDATDPTRFPAPSPPSFVGNNYYCDYPYNGFLWDGKNCRTPCCTFNSPPWFNVTLPSSTTDNIEVRMCTDESFSDERVYVQKIQLFVK